MTAAQSLLITVEIFVSLLLIWGFIHEDKVIAFEKWISRFIAVKYRQHKRKKQLARKKSASPQIVRSKSYDPMVVHKTPDRRGKVA